MLYYCPLEPYKERYTMQWSGADTGWLERNWLRSNIKYKRLKGTIGSRPSEIKTGYVLDAVGRSIHCFRQIEELLLLVESEKLTSNDVIYFDDFWHPGIEALPYVFALKNLEPKVFAWCHAQSVDQFDFTWRMRGWMRHFERGIGKFLTGIFVNSTALKELLLVAEIAPTHKIHAIGLPFCSEEVKERTPKRLIPMREDKIIFSSRWDDEKNPIFALKVAEEVSRLTGLHVGCVHLIFKNLIPAHA